METMKRVTKKEFDEMVQRAKDAFEPLGFKVETWSMDWKQCLCVIGKNINSSAFGEMFQIVRE